MPIQQALRTLTPNLKGQSSVLGLLRRSSALSWDKGSSCRRLSLRFRCFSSSTTPQQQRPPVVRILYGSQGGTAQMFAMQLHQELEERWGGGHDTKDGDKQDSLEIRALNEVVGTMESSADIHNANADDIHVILVSVTGVGEPPDNARIFYDWLMTRDSPMNLKYTLFGLGNSIAHPKHYNVIAKNMDSKLQELGAQRVYPMGLGDDGDCIEDDFDQWMEGLLRRIRTAATDEDTPPVEDSPNSGSVRNVQHIVPPTKARNEPLLLRPPVALPSIHKNLMHVPFYQDHVDWMEVVAHRTLSLDGGEQGLRELYLQLPPNVTYEAGDHVILYPRNSRCMVDALLQLYKPTGPHSVIVDGGPGYPHPAGISIYETLTHCVDLGALFRRRLRDTFTGGRY
ncbi:FAD-binding domain-containing protein [Fragilaria crotonensis]|nr:FAD-binding domain-containing protein [Fragilaria crotonensis]